MKNIHLNNFTLLQGLFFDLVGILNNNKKSNLHGFSDLEIYNK